MTALIDWEHAHDELVKATFVVIGIIALMVVIGFIAAKMEPTNYNVNPMQYQYMPYY